MPRLEARYAAATLCLCALLGASTGVAQETTDSTLRILYEGRSGGVSAPYPELPIDTAVEAALGAGFARTRGGFGAMLADDGWLIAADGGVRRFESLAGAPLGLGAPVDAPILIADDWVITVWPPDAAARVIPDLAERLVSPADAPAPTVITRPARANAGGLIHIGVPGIDPEPGPFQPREAEARLVVSHRGQIDGAPAVVHVISRLRGEGTRRVARLRAWRDDATLYVAAGDSLEGRSFLPGVPLSLQRDVSWHAFREMGLDVLVPSTNELLAGPVGLRDEAAAAGTVLVSSNLRDGSGAPVFAPWTVVERAGKRVLVLGWTPHTALDELAPALRAGLRLHGEEVIPVVLADALTSLSSPPDLVVLVGIGAAGLGGRLHGVDLVLADFAGDGRVARTNAADTGFLEARDAMRRSARDAALVGSLGPRMVGRVDVGFGPSGGLVSAIHRAEPIAEDAAVDPLTRAEVQEIRQEIYASREDILIPDPTSLIAPRGWKRAPLPTSLDAPTFAALAGNLLLDRTGSDLAILRPLPPPLQVPGPRAAFVVDSSLTILDEVVLIDLYGREIKLLLKALDLIEPTAARRLGTADGWLLGANPNGVVGGRKIVDGDLLRVATTTYFTEDPRVRPLLQQALVITRFAGRAWRRSAHPKGRPWLVRELIREGLEALRDDDPAFGARYGRRAVPLLTRSGGWYAPRFELVVENLALGVTGSLGFKPATGYEGSNESRATLSDSLATEVRGRLSVGWSDRYGGALGFVQGNFSRSQEEGVDEPIELADDLLAGAEARVNLGVTRDPKGGVVPLSSFVQGAFDTEFTPPNDPASGAPLIRQQLVRTTAGVSLGPLGWLREARLGFFVEADLAAESGTFSPGFSAAALTEHRWGPVKWSNRLDFRGHLPTAGDTEADLSIHLDLRTELGILPLRRIIPGLSVGAYADFLLFRGQIAGVNTTPGAHLLVGAQIRYDAILRGPVRLR